MAGAEHANWAEQLRSERALLVKAEVDIEEGWKRLRSQQDLVLWLRRAGHDTNEAERLASLLKQTLIEWERHRTLIAQRVAYLEGQVTSS
ncbi:hypothetical protein [Bradyrhizobium embrapense]|uniref:hypothetical protein n=1 Tax=Bradyrhizobium embrapense TaxID=630921 RepID=UPI00067C8609|nr:hypothetical protein [Bradyrhizobium embrapense]